MPKVRPQDLPEEDMIRELRRRARQRIKELKRQAGEPEPPAAPSELRPGVPTVLARRRPTRKQREYLA